MVVDEGGEKKERVSVQTSEIVACYRRFRWKRRQVHSRGIGRACPGEGGDIPDVVFCVVVRTILVGLADSGGHVEEARVEEHK